MRDYNLHLTDILHAIDSIERFVEGLEPESFKHDDKTSSAVIRKFEIIGEAAKNVPNEVQRQYPGIPWKEMAGMRDKLIHFYFGVDYDLVWSTINNRLPQLKLLISKAISKEK